MTINAGRHYADATTAVFEGDCLERLRQLPDSSVDSVCTDPPYGLANTDPGHVVEALTKWATGERDFIPTGKGFMGKAWDAFVPPPAVWDECLRVLKPGGHLLAFAGSRTFDLMTLSIRMAGFDIRDSIAWLYGSGFPKSLDVSKAIDKARDDRADWRVVCRWLRDRITDAGHTTMSVAEHFGFNRRMVEHWAALDTDSQPTLATLEQWDALRDLLGFGDELDAEVYRLNMRKGEPGQAWKDRPVVGQHRESIARGTSGLTVGGDGKEIRGGGSPAARQWQGWGTALKPAFEPIVVARKPLIGTVAANVLEHGTGALNIDASRIHTEGSQGKAYNVKRLKPGATLDKTGGNWRPESEDAVRFEGKTKDGRFPANVILDESQAAALDEQSGTLKSGANPKRRGADKGRTVLGEFAGQEDANPQRGVDTGGASRFFYTAKAGTKERPKAEDGTAHPTVKPLALMRYLVKLVTPPGGIVLEPFAGSGTTVEAARLEGFRVIGIERDPSYLPLIQQRIDRSKP